MRWMVILVIALYALACNSPNADFSFPEGNRIYTRDDARLFFQNIRSPYYHKEEREKTGIRMYRLKDQAGDASGPNILLTIADAWQRNEVYLIPEPNEWFQMDTFSIHCQCDDRASTLAYSPMPPAAASRWIYELYRLREKGCILRVNNRPLFNPSQEKVFKKVVQDYLKWIE